MSKETDMLLLASIFVAILSGALNLHLWIELSEKKNLLSEQQTVIETMERTLLLQD